MTLEWVSSSCFLILVVLVLRAALGSKINARFRYALWALVLVRLLVPVQLFTSPVAGMRVGASAQIWEQMQEESIYVLPLDSMPMEDAKNVTVGENGRIYDANSFGYPKLENNGKTITRYADKISPLQALKMLWFSGGIVLALALLASNLSFAARLHRVRKPIDGKKHQIPVYLADGLPSPCLFGVLKPAVYVTAETLEKPEMLRHVLAHELTHYRHLDHIWSILRGIALAVHWWNPLVWLAVLFSRRDGELACDEGALKQLGREERIAYGETLLALVTAKPNLHNLLSFATTMSGEKRSLQDRVRRIACEPKQLAGAVIAVVIVVSATSVCAFGRAAEEAGDSTDIYWWKTAQITIDEAGVPCIHYVSNGQEYDKYGSPIPAPAEWAEQDLAGRNEATVLTNPPDGHLWTKMVSADNGWLVVCWGQGIGIADTYVYRTTDGGLTWTETAMPDIGWHVAAVGFLSPERLIIAQELLDGAPVLITRDGGKSWEEIEVLIDWESVDEKIDDAYAVSDIYVYGNMVQMVFMGDFAMNWTMTSTDLGDTWTADKGVVWEQFFETLSVEDIGELNNREVSASELVQCLKRASQLDRIPSGYMELERPVWAVWTVPLTDGSTMWLGVCAKDPNKVIQIILETAGQSYAMLYSSEELYMLVLGAGSPYTGEMMPYTPDLDRDGKLESLWTVTSEDSSIYALACMGVGEESPWSWFQTAYSSHAGWNALFLCRMNGQDYLLQYNPYMSGGVCEYDYRLFYLQEGREVTVQENNVNFDMVFHPEFADSHVFDPKAIASFMEEINALLADSVQLLNTDENLLGTFEKEGRLYDSLWWLDDDRDESLSLLENLLAYRNKAVQEAKGEAA